MNILYYLEPWIEKQNAKYRKYSFFHQVLPLVRALSNRYYDEVEIKIIVGDGIDKAYDKGVCTEYPAYDISVISQQDLRKCFLDYKKAVSLDYNEIFDANQTRLFQSLLNEKIGDFIPDIVISYESSINIFKQVFPNALCLVEYFGAFSRPPFPVTLTLDAGGIYKNSLLVQCKSDLNALPSSPEATNFMSQIRRIYFEESLNKYSIEPELFLSIRQKHKYIVLLPLQGSNYFAFEENARYTNMLDYIMDVLDNIHPDVAVLVSEHSDREQIVNSSNCYYLQKTYPNFYYIPDIGTLPNHSQLLLKEVDGVIMVTSGVGFLAGILQKPVFQIGTYESFLSSGSKITDIFSFLENNRTVDKDPSFHHLFTHFYFTNEEIANPEILFSFLKQLLNNYREGKSLFHYYDRKDTDSSTLERFKNGIRNKELKAKLNDHPYFKKQLPCLSQETPITGKDIKTVSFDIFDTLLIRPFHEPHMLFAYMQPYVETILNNVHFTFHDYRVMAESQARKSKQLETNAKFSYEVTLDEIYLKLQEICNITSEEASEIMSYELESEKNALTLRPDVSDLYAQAVKTGKRIILISDTYFPEYFIKSVLDKNGITDYDDLYLSSVMKARKHDGALFKLLIKEFDLEPHSTLHIGDNRGSDNKQPEALGFKTMCIQRSTANLLKYENFFTKLAEKTKLNPYHSAIMATIAHRYFNHTPRKNLLGSSFHGDAVALGFSGMGPLLLSYCLWLYENAVADNVDCLVFLARDGNIIKKVYDELSEIFDKKIETKYIRTSRRAALVANMKTKDDIYRALQPKIIDCTVQHIFEHRLGIVISADDETHVKYAGFKHRFQIISQLHDMAKLKKLVDILEARILNNAIDERTAYLRYLDEQNITTDNTKNYAVVDIGYAGTMQKNLSNILGIKLNGYYVGTRYTATALIKSGLAVKGYLFHLDHHDGEIRHPFNDFIGLFETLFSCDENSLKCYRLRNNVLTEEYYETDVEVARKKLTINIHKGILLFTADMKKSFGRKLLDFSISKDYILQPLLSFFRDPHPIDARIFEGIGIEDTTAQMKTRMLVPDLSIYNPKEIKSLTDFLIAGALWKPGIKALINHIASSTNKPKDNNKPKENINSVKKIYDKNDLNFRRKQKMEKFVNSPNEFFNDSTSKLTYFLKPFSKSIEQRKKIRKLVIDPYQYFNESRNRFIRILRFPFKQCNKHKQI